MVAPAARLRMGRRPFSSKRGGRPREGRSETPRMRRSVKWAIAAAAAAAATTAGFYRWPIASSRVGVEFNRAMPAIGLHWRRPARASLTLLPWPSLSVVGVDLVAADGRSLLTAPTARFSLSLAALARGHFTPDGVTLESLDSSDRSRRRPGARRRARARRRRERRRRRRVVGRASARRRAACRERLASPRHADRESRRSPPVALRRAAALLAGRRLARPKRFDQGRPRQSAGCAAQSLRRRRADDRTRRRLRFPPTANGAATMRPASPAS